VFFGEWASYLDELAVAPQQLLITGDLNFTVINQIHLMSISSQDY
jgi:hypothetical protein